MSGKEATDNKEESVARRIVRGMSDGVSPIAGFQLEDVPMPEPGEGEVLLRVLYLALDPIMCSHTHARTASSRRPEPGTVIDGETVAQIVSSRHPDYREGEFVLSRSGWRTHAVATSVQILRRLDPALAPLSTALGLYGAQGLIAWTALRETGKPRPGETVLVADAGTAIGAAAGQIARLRGARVVGIARGARACVFVREALGFDAAVNGDARYAARRLRAACPDGVDVYLENADGALWEPIWPLFNECARVAICRPGASGAGLGLRPGFGGAARAVGDRLPAMMHAIVARGLIVRGFIHREFSEYYPEFLREMGEWLRNGLVRYREEVIDGLENAPQALADMLQGRYLGKPLVRVASPE